MGRRDSPVRCLVIGFTTVFVIIIYYGLIENNQHYQAVIKGNKIVTEKDGKFQTILQSETQIKNSSLFLNMLQKSRKLWKTNKLISDTIQQNTIQTKRKLESKVKNISTKHSVFDSVRENMTIVTAYFDIGSFQNGFGETVTSKMYFKWSKTFAYLVNPLVIYTDSQEFADLMKKHRYKFPSKTVIKRIQKNDIWAFKCLDKIKSVYSQSGYPKYHPNTVIPAYSSVQHSKFAVVADAVRHNFFNTEFYAWLDVGYFRHIVLSQAYFRLDAPTNIDKNKLGMNRVYSPSFSETPFNIMRQSVVWVGGGMFIGTKMIVLRFEILFQKAVYYFLSKKLMNTDEQVIYSMYSNEGRAALKPDIELQLFLPTGNGIPWFYQGYLCRHVLTNLTVT